MLVDVLVDVLDDVLVDVRVDVLGELYHCVTLCLYVHHWISFWHLHCFWLTQSEGLHFHWIIILLLLMLSLEKDPRE